MDEKISSRIPELDLARGFAVFLMIFDHAMYDLTSLFPSLLLEYPARGYDIYRFAQNYWNWDVRGIVRYFVVFVFLALTGICCSFSRSNLRRGIRLFGVAMGLTVVTLLAGLVIGDTDITITFGVLHCIAVTLILIGILEQLRPPKELYLIVGSIMLAIGIYILAADRIEIHKLGYENIALMVIKQIVGTMECGGDTFPLFLNGGQILIGVYLGKLLYRDRHSLFPYLQYKNGPVKFVGRHSLIVYIAHQAVIPVAGCIVFLLCGYHLCL